MQSEFGKTSAGELIHVVVVSQGDLTVGILTYGAVVHSVLFPDKQGNVADLVLGYDTVAEYEKNTPYLGVVVGRVAGRVKNATFSIPTTACGDQEVVSVNLPKNDGPNCLHGGWRGLSRRIWSVVALAQDSVTLSYKSPDGEEGFPGVLDISVTYTVEKGNRLRIEYSAKVSKTCPLNITNHSYFNLAGEGAPNVYDHEVVIRGTLTAVLGTDLLPTGKLAPLDPPLNTSQGVQLTKELLDHIGVSPPYGYDCYVVFDSPGLVKSHATIRHKASGRVLDLYTDQPGVQFYTGNFLNDEPGKAGHLYQQHSAVCLEAQGYPDAPNRPEFPSSFVCPNKVYQQTTVYQFSLM